MRNSLQLIGIGCALVMARTFFVPGAHAQDFDIGLTTTQCDGIVANALSNPAQRDTLRLVRHCQGAFGATMSTLLERTELLATDTTTYFDIVYVSSHFREDDIFETLLVLATDAGHPDIARAAALAVIYSYITDGGVEPQLEYLRTFSGPASGCTSAASASDFTHEGEFPLGSQSKSDALSVAEAILASGAGNVVKFMASCVYNRLYSGNSGVGPTGIPPFNPTTDFSYVKQCGRTFLIRNASRHWVAGWLKWAGGGTRGSKPWSMPPRRGGAAYSESSWTVPGTTSGSSTASFFLTNPTLVLFTESPDNTPC